MAKIDTSTIEGYADMTAEAKLAALEAFELPDPDYSGYVKKSEYDKAAKELSQAKKSLAEAEGGSSAKVTELEEKVANLEKEKKISGYKAEYLAAGYDEKLAQETAEALVAGDSAKVFANQKAFLEAHDKELKKELLKGTPGMPGGTPGGDDTVSDDLALANKIAKQSANAAKAAAEGIKHYF